MVGIPVTPATLVGSRVTISDGTAVLFGLRDGDPTREGCRVPPVGFVGVGAIDIAGANVTRAVGLDVSDAVAF